MSSTDVHTRTNTSSPLLAMGIVAVVVSIVVNAGVALATRSWDPNGTRTGLTLLAYGPMTALGVVAGTAGWAIVRRRSARPRAVLRVLVPAVVVLSFIPDVVLLVTGTSPGNVIGLWVMHVVVAVVTVATASRVLPLVDKDSSSPTLR
jgi:hypothetical protein